MQKKNKKSNKKNNKKIFKSLIIVILIILVVILIISSINHSKKVSDKKNNTTSVETLELSDITSITLSELDSKLKTDEDFVLYIGYEGCSACQNYAPVLQRSQAQLGFNLYYLNIKEINTSSKIWTNFLKKVTIKQTLHVSTNEDSSDTTTIEDTIGNITKKYGYTPTTIHIVAGKVTNAHIGSLSSSEIEEFIK